MHQIDSTTAVAVLPTPEPTGDPGYFKNSVPGVSLPTAFTADWFNSVQGELLGLLILGDGEGVGSETASKTENLQLKTQIEKYVNARVAAGGGGGGGASTEDVVQTAHGFNKYDAIKNNGTIFVGAQGDALGNSDAIGVVSEVDDVNNFTVTYGGLIEWNVPATPDYTLGSDIYLSTTISGGITDTPISYANGEVKKYLGEALSGGLFVNVDVGEVISDPVSTTWVDETSKTADYTLLASDDNDLIYLDSTAVAERTFTLKAAPSNKDIAWIFNDNATYRLIVSDGVDDILYLFEGEAKKFTYSTVLSKWSISEA